MTSIPSSFQADALSVDIPSTDVLCPVTTLSAREQALADLSPDGIFIIAAAPSVCAAGRRDTGYPICYANRRFVEMTGYPLHQCLGVGWEGLLQPMLLNQERNNIGEYLQCMFDGQLPESSPEREWRFQICHRDGTWFWVVLQWTPMLDAQGRLENIAAKLQRILPELMVDEKPLTPPMPVPETYSGLSTGTFSNKQDSGASLVPPTFLSPLLNQVSDALVWVDMAGCVTEWNPAAEKLFGYARKEVLGLELIRLLLPPDSWATYQTYQKEAASSGLNPLSFEMPVLICGGKSVAAQWTMHYWAQGVFSIMIQKSAVAEVVERNESLAAQQQQIIFDSVPAMIWYKDANNRILRVNKQAADTMQMTVKDIEGKYTEELYPEVDSAKYHADDMQVINSGSPSLGLLDPYRMKSGEKRWVRSDKLPYRNSQGDVVGVIVFSQDITETIRTQEELKLLQSITLDILKAESLQSALQTVITQVCSFSGWEFGQVWAPDAQGEKLVCGTSWYSSAPALGAYRDECESAELSLGEGLAGSVWQSTETQWVSSVEYADNLFFKKKLAESGIESAIAFPIMVEKSVAMVLEFLIRCPSGEDEHRIHSINTIAAQLGAMIQHKKAEDAVKRSQVRFHNLVNANSIGMIFTSATGIIDQANDAFLRMVGYSREDMEKGLLCWRTLTPPEYLQQDEQVIRQFMETGYVEPYEKEYIHKDGHRVSGLVAVARLSDEVGDAVGFIIDITQQKHYEKALKSSEARFRQVVESNMFGIFFASMDGVLWDANDAFLEIIGYPRSEFVSREISWWTLSPEESWPEDKRVIDSLLDRSRDGQQRKVLPFEKQFIHHDGHRVDVLFGAALLEGRDDHCVCFVLNITKQKQAENILRESEAYLRSIIDYEPVMVWITDEQASVTFFNRGWCEFTGRNLEQDLGFGWKEPIHPEDADRVEAAYLGYFSKRECFEQEFRLRRSNGEYRWVLGAGSPRFGMNGEFLGYIGTCVDIHERKEMEVELAVAKQAAENANQNKSQVLANLSHEFRTPLNAIIGFSQVLRDNFAQMTEEKREKYLENISMSGNHLLTMINDILDISKIEAGKIDIYPEPIHLPSFVNDLKMIIGELASQRGIQVLYEVTPGIGLLEVDPVRFRQIILNLVSNALKFNRPEGSVTLHFWKSGDGEDTWLFCSVKDTGIGIAPDKIGNLFSKFYQVDNACSRKAQGTGLGLALTRQLVELHGGEIWVESEPDVGSTFTFKIPTKAITPQT